MNPNGTIESPSAPALRRLIADTFSTDPLLVWMFPDASSRLDATAAWLGLYVDAYVSNGTVHTVQTDDRPVATAMWRRHGETVDFPELPTLRGLLEAIVGVDHAEVVGSGFRPLRELVPSENHDYLQFLAVSPDLQGQGLGSSVLQTGLDRCDADGIPAYLESTNSRNLDFYRAHAFEVRDEVRLGPSGPTLWTMLRQPIRHR